MQIILILVIASIVIAGGFLIAFVWASKRGQFRDMHTPAIRMLFDDKPANTDNKRNAK